MREGCVKGTYPFNPVSHEPVKALDKEKEAEHQAEGHIKFVAENGECE